MSATNTCPDALRERPNVLPAAIVNLLLSNEPPSDAEIPTLNKLNALISMHLTRLDDEIASLLSSEKTVTLDQLKKDRALLQDRSRQVLGALSAIRRFPKEILQQVFLKLIPDTGFEVFDPLQGPWAVSRVCTSWRSASRLPRLWTALRITSDGCSCRVSGGPVHRCDPFSTSKKPTGLLRAALRYSGSRKLDFHVEFRYQGFGRDVNWTLNLLDDLMLHSERWAHVSFVLPSRVGLYLRGVRGKVSQLKRLSFVGTDPDCFWEDYGEDDLPVIRAFEVAPRLKQVSVENALLCINYPPLTSFTSKFGMYFPHPVPPLFVIGHCPDLVHLDYYVEPMYYGADQVEIRTVVPRIANTSLTRLTINDPTPLASLSLPALLSLDVGDKRRVSCLPLIPPFLEASQCSLTALYFRNSTLSGAPLEDILALVPSLTHLGIVFHSDSDAMAHRVGHVDGVLWQLMKSLSEVDGSERRHALLPTLEGINFDLRAHPDFFGATWTFVGPELVDMLRSRVKILRKARFRFDAHPGVGLPNLVDASIVALRGMKDGGLDIAICDLNGKSFF